MAYTLGNKSAKNLCKWTVLLQLIIENVVTCFLEHSVCSLSSVKLYTCLRRLFILLPSHYEAALSSVCMSIRLRIPQNVQI